MRKLATAFLLLAGLAGATTAWAVDLEQKNLPDTSSPQFILAMTLFCDNGAAVSAYFQDDVGRYGNVFNFGAGARLSHVTFAHYGFGFAGPYNYDIELWDPTSCTMITAVNGLVAQDAAGDIAVEAVDVCPREITLAGNVIVAIDANTCLNPADCYPDVLFDNQLNVACPYIVDASGGQCFDVSAQSGPFLLRVVVDDCPVPARAGTWGALKGIYR